MTGTKVSIRTALRGAESEQMTTGKNGWQLRRARPEMSIYILPETRQVLSLSHSGLVSLCDLL